MGLPRSAAGTIVAGVAPTVLIGVGAWLGTIRLLAAWLPSSPSALDRQGKP